MGRKLNTSKPFPPKPNFIKAGDSFTGTLLEVREGEYKGKPTFTYFLEAIEGNVGFIQKVGDVKADVQVNAGDKVALSGSGAIIEGMKTVKTGEKVKLLFNGLKGNYRDFSMEVID